MTAWHSYTQRDAKIDGEQREHEQMMREGCEALLAAILALLEQREARA